jgi:serine/threonine protein kinase
VVHRDIEPSNLLIDAKGHLLVTDFGLAQKGTGDNLALPSDILGTLRYMSPEQAQGTILPARGRRSSRCARRCPSWRHPSYGSENPGA